MASAIDDIAGVADDVAGSLDDIAGSLDDVAGMGDDVAGLGDDLAGLGDDVAGLGDDVAGLGDDVAGLGDDAAGLGDDAAGLGDDAASNSSLLDKGTKVLAGLGTLGGITLTVIFFTAPELLGKGLARVVEGIASPAAEVVSSFFSALGLGGVGDFIKKYSKYFLLGLVLCCIISAVVASKGMIP